MMIKAYKRHNIIITLPYIDLIKKSPNPIQTTTASSVPLSHTDCNAVSSGTQWTQKAPEEVTEKHSTIDVVGKNR